jgi:hypothetical protein
VLRDSTAGHVSAYCIFSPFETRVRWASSKTFSRQENPSRPQEEDDSTLSVTDYVEATKNQHANNSHFHRRFFFRLALLFECNYNHTDENQILYKCWIGFFQMTSSYKVYLHWRETCFINSQFDDCLIWFGAWSCNKRFFNWKLWCGKLCCQTRDKVDSASHSWILHKFEPSVIIHFQTTQLQSSDWVTHLEVKVSRLFLNAKDFWVRV